MKDAHLSQFLYQFFAECCRVYIRFVDQDKHMAQRMKEMSKLHASCLSLLHPPHQ